MRLSCLQENLARGLATVGRAVASRSTLPITQNVLLRTQNGMLMLHGTNLELAITTHIGAMIEAEGDIAVPHRLLSDLVASLPSDRVDLDIPSEDDVPGTVLHIRCGRSVTQINGAASRDYPPVTAKIEGAMLTVAPEIFRRGVHSVAFSAATDESRPVLTGIYFALQDDILEMASADGFRLSIFREQLPGALNEPVKVIIPASAAREVERLAQGGDPVRMTLNEGQASFDLGHTILVSQLLQGKFPDYGQLIPDRYDTRVVMELDDFKRAVNSARVFADTGSSIVRLEMRPEDDAGLLKMSARSEEYGETEREFPLTAIDGDQNRIAFNVRYLRELAGVMGRGDLALEMTNGLSPGLFKFANSEGFAHVVMPMYVQW